MNLKSLFILMIHLGLSAWSCAQELPPHDLNKSPIRSDPEYEMVMGLTPKSISELPINSPLLYNAYKFILTTHSLANDHYVDGKVKKPAQASSWRNAALIDIRRRGVAAQQVVEQIYQDSNGKALSLLVKIEYLPEIDKRPFVGWVRKTLEEGKYREMRSVELSLKADFIAKHGNLDDLTFLEQIGTEVPMDRPKYLRLI